MYIYVVHFLLDNKSHRHTFYNLGMAKDYIRMIERNSKVTGISVETVVRG